MWYTITVMYFYVRLSYVYLGWSVVKTTIVHMNYDFDMFFASLGSQSEDWYATVQHLAALLSSFLFMSEVTMHWYSMLIVSVVFLCISFLSLFPPPYSFLISLSLLEIYILLVLFFSVLSLPFHTLLRYLNSFLKDIFICNSVSPANL